MEQKGNNVLTVGEYQLYERGDRRLVRFFGKEIGVEDTSLSVLELPTKGGEVSVTA